MHRFLRIVICFLLFISKQIAYSQNVKYFSVRKIGVTEGKKMDVENTDCIEDSKGFIWYYSTAGLQKFNGTRFVTYTNFEQNNKSLNTHVRFFCELKIGKFILFVDNVGLLTFDDNTEVFSKVEIQNDTFLRANALVNTGYVSTDNYLWIALTYKGVIRINLLNYQSDFIDLKDPETGYGFISTAWVNGFCESKLQKKVYAITNHGVVEINKNNLAVNYLFKDGDPRFSKSSIGGILEDEHGDLWLGTWSWGLVKYNVQNKIWKNYAIKNNVPIGNGIENILHSIRRKSSTELWLGTQYGVQIFDLEKEKFYAIGNQDLEIQTIEPFQHPSRYISVKGWNLITTKSGNLFCEEGIVLNSSRHYSYHVVKLGKYAGGSSMVGEGVANPFNPGEIFLSSAYGSGLYKWENGVSTTVAELPDAQFDVHVLKVQNELLWIGTNVGLFLYDLKNSKKTWNLHVEILKEFKGKLIYDITFFKGNMYLLADGIYEYNFSTKRIQRFVKYHGLSLPQTSVNKIKFDKLGNLWIAMEDGTGLVVYTISGKKMEYNQYFDKIKSYARDIEIGKDGTIYCPLVFYGLLVIQNPLQKQEKVRVLQREDGLMNLALSNSFVDNNGLVWISSWNGLYVLNPINMQIKTMDYYTGMPDMFISGKCSQYDAKHILVPLRNGFTVLDNSLFTNSALPTIPIHIYRFLVNNLPVKSNVNYRNRIDLSYIENNLFLQFAGLEFDYPAGLVYYYRLKGLHENWINLGNNGAISLPALSSGEFELQIRVAGLGDPIPETGYSLYIQISPPFWKTIWFYLLILLVISTIVYVIIKFRIRQLMRVERVRNTIAKDLHDDVGSTMTSISILSEVATLQIENEKKPVHILQEIGQNARGLLESMDDIVWSINTNNDNLEQIILRIKNVSIALLSNKGVEVEFEIGEGMEKKKLEMTQRRNIYLICKEAIHNISKYAEAKKVWISILEKGNAWQIRIKDNGTGFDLESHKVGNGLKNMQERAESSKIQLKIQSFVGDGTEVLLIIN